MTDKDGSLAKELDRQIHEGHPDSEGIVWPRLAEVSLLGALGCGSSLLSLVLGELELPRCPYDFAVLQVRQSPFAHSLSWRRPLKAGGMGSR